MKKLLILAMTVLALGLVAGCGDDDDDGGGGEPATTEEPAATAPAETEAEGGGGEALALEADPGGSLAFDQTELSAPAGTVTITMTNPSDVPHNVAIDGGGVDEEGEVVTSGGVSEVSAELEPGGYSFYCSVPGHRDGGMEGTLTIE